MSWRYISAVQGAQWPASPDSPGALVMALLYQLESTQWLQPAQLRTRQEGQLARLLAHSYETVPFYRTRWAAPPDVQQLSELPLLRRRDLQDEFDALKSRSIPAGHGEVRATRTSGSTGAPVQVLKTQVQQLFWRAITLRDHRWHGRDLAGTLAVIRKGAGRGSSPTWGAATEGLIETGPCLVHDVDADVSALLDWLRRHEPAYLLTYPSLVAELARISLERGVRMPALHEVRTLGESLDADMRAACWDAWDARVVDMYSTEEVGYLALQCPHSEAYHVQSENVLVEVLDERGRNCGPGETGRIVVTDLHNFAMPLVRYELGDLAEVGVPCACGRGLPVLNRIAGRVRNMLVTPQGARFWPSSGLRKQTEVPKLRQYQFVQRSPDLIEARMVVSQPLTPAEEDYVRSRIQSRLPKGVQVQLKYVDAIPRGPGGKYEEFVCEVPRA